MYTGFDPSRFRLANRPIKVVVSVTMVFNSGLNPWGLDSKLTESLVVMPRTMPKRPSGHF